MTKAVALAIVLLSAATARAATVEQIIALSKAGVSETVLVALIDRDKSVFALDFDELVALKEARVSEAVVLAMLKSGRPQVPADAWAATAMPPLVGPDTLVVGHGPDVPNSSSAHTLAAAATTAPFVPYFFALPYRREGCAPVAPADSSGTLLTTAPAVGHFTGNPFRPVSKLAPDAIVVGCQGGTSRGRSHQRR